MKKPTIDDLPDAIHETRGNHSSALSIADGIEGYCKQAVEHLAIAGNDKIAPLVRGGHLKAAWDLLETISAHSRAVQNQLCIAYFNDEIQ